MGSGVVHVITDDGRHFTQKVCVVWVKAVDVGYVQVVLLTMPK